MVFGGLLVTLLGCRPVEWSGDGPAISNLRLSPVPNPLAVRVRFHTSEPAVGAVEFGPGDTLEWRVEDRGGDKDHDLVVFGLHADEGFRLDIVAEDDRGGVSRTVPERWQTGLVLDGLAMDVLPPSSEPSPAEPWPSPTPGWTLLDLSEDVLGAPSRAVMVDEDGRIVWISSLEGHDVGALDASVTPAGAVLLGGSVPTGARPTEVGIDGEVRWEGPVQVGFDATGYQHHHLDHLASETWLGPEKDVRGAVRGDRVVERDEDGEEVWSWSTWDHWIPELDKEEWTHLNWVHRDGDVLYLSDRKGDAIWKIDRRTGEPLWQLGEGGDFALASGSWFAGQHAPEVLPDGRILVYDNGVPVERTRVVEYTLDEETMTATQTWVFDGGEDEAWFTGWWGDVDVLPDDRLLVCAGNPQERRVMEVTRSGEVVWAAVWPEPFSSYRAERVDPGRWGWSRLP